MSSLKQIFFVLSLAASAFFILSGCEDGNPTLPNPNGTIEITSAPDSLDATWSLTGPDDFSRDGAGHKIFTDLALGNYAISWADIDGFVTPLPNTVELEADALLIFTGNFIAQIPGQIMVDPDPDDIVSTWSLTGPGGFSYEGTGEETVTDLWPGEYSLVWGPIVNWVSPDSTTIQLEYNADVVQVGFIRI